MDLILSLSKDEATESFDYRCRTRIAGLGALGYPLEP